MERSSVMWGKVSLRNASHSNLFCERQKGFLCVQPALLLRKSLLLGDLVS